MPNILLWILIAIFVLWILGYLGGGTNYSAGSPPTGYRVVYGPSGGYFWPGAGVLVVVIILLFVFHVI